MEQTTMSATQSPVSGTPRDQAALPVSHAAAHSPAPARTETANPGAMDEPEFAGPKRVGYGLPCARCKTYYAADLKSCPVCKATDRVAAVSAIKTNKPVADEKVPDPDTLEAERERFLRDFKSQSYAALQLSPSAGANCTRNENHQGSTEPATICQACHDQLQERVDVLEAVLHMDVKEAADIIYDAVWSDPSDPSKTYQNAAQAILNELKKRSGITQVFGPLQPLPH